MSKTIHRGNPKIQLGNQMLKHMTLNLLTDFPSSITEKVFKDLPHHGWDKPAPVLQALRGSAGYFRFRFPPENKWMLGYAVNRRIINCWETDFPPFISCRDEFVNRFVSSSFKAAPDLSGQFGTLIGAELITCALDTVPEYVLWEWLEHKEKQRQGVV